MSGYPQVPRGHADTAQHLRLLADGVNRALSGRLNITGEVTLAAGATATTITDPRISAVSLILLDPRSASAAAALPSVYVGSQSNGTAVLRHDSAPATDRTFRYAVIG